MGAPNFARPSNASNYFVVLTKSETKYKECDECNHRHYEWEYDLEKLTECENECENPTFSEDTETTAPDEFEYQDLKDNIGNSIAEIGGDVLDESFDNDRNYHRQSVGKLQEDKYYGDIEVNIRLTAVIQSAYYEGATLDYIIEIDNGESWEEVDDQDTVSDIIDDLFQVEYNDYNYSDMSKGLRVIQSKNAVKWVEQQLPILSNKLEEIFKVYSSHKLQCNGVFSNGEAIYSEVK
jgi:hypothetical protein